MLSIAASRRSIRYSGERSCRDIAKQGPIPTVITRDARFLEESLAGGLAPIPFKIGANHSLLLS